MINGYNSSGGNWSAGQWGQMASTFYQAGNLAHQMGSASGFQSGGIVPAKTLAAIKKQISGEWTQLDALYKQEDAATGARLAQLKQEVSQFWTNIMDPLYAAEDKLKAGSSGSSGKATGHSPIPSAAAQKVFDAFEETFKNMPGPWNKLASQILAGLTQGIKNAPQTAAAAQALVNKVKTEIAYGQGVTNTAVSGFNFGGLQVATPTMTAQGKPYQYYIDQQNIAAGGQPGSVQEQMGSYLQAMQSFQGDMGKLAKGGLQKRLLSQLYAAGPIQGDAEAQSIMGGAGGIKAANQLWNQINSTATKLGVQAIGAQYGMPGQLTGKSVHAGRRLLALLPCTSCSLRSTPCTGNL